MKLAYSTNAFTRTDLPSALNGIADLGFAAAEILCDWPHWQPGKVSEADISGVAELLAARGLAVSNLNVNTANGYFDPLPAENIFEPSLSSRNPTWREWRIEYTIEAIRLAARLGASCVSVTSGQSGSGGIPAEGLSLFVDSLKRVCDVAATHGIRVGVEYEPGLLVERASELADVISRVDSPVLGANLDIGHSYLDGESAEDAVDALRGRIWNVHVEDIAQRKHFHLIPGLGDLPFKRYFSALQRAGYDRYLTLELYTYPDMPEEAGRRSLAYLRDLLAEMS
jgi:sugar phosphate isomerase/epimerase